MDQKKLRKQILKVLGQVNKHNNEIELSPVPTKFLVVGNTSISCGVSYDDLEEIFTKFDAGVNFIVYPAGRSYSFVIFTNCENATTALQQIQGTIPDTLKKYDKTFVPFIGSYVKSIPKEIFNQNKLFPTGMKIVKDFINEKDSEELIKYIEQLAEKDGNTLKNRTVLHFGYKFNYDSNCALEQATPIPPQLEALIRKLIFGKVLNGQIPDQITINIYEENQGIPFHVDTHSAFGNQILSLSLLSDVVMQFKDCTNPAIMRDVLLDKNCLLVMEEDSRYKWKHGILSRKYDINPITNRIVKRQKRISITFRKVQSTKCECKFIEYCDWDRNGEMAIPADDKKGKHLESTYVQEVYENIADHFDETRYSQWKAVSNFIDGLAPYSVLLDLGCGNGKYLIREDNLIKIGSDLCFNLCRIASKKKCDVVQGDILNLPFKHDLADAVISIAVIHHMSTEARRIQAFQQLANVLKVGGRGCVTVWAMDQKASQYEIMRSNKDEEEETISDCSLLRVHNGKQFSQQDMLVPWQKDKTGEQQFLRYYHMFVEGELEKLVNKVDGLEVIEVILEQGNYIVTFQKNC
uniref:S-adenosyl-L-methionine-dependent tRNA methyltransferase ABH8 n=1 Tax=Rhabditophanes sp. KR3021 TaxID=114890 RepID=A0AC35U0V7_9BILA